MINVLLAILMIIIVFWFLIFVVGITIPPTLFMYFFISGIYQDIKNHCKLSHY